MEPVISEIQEVGEPLKVSRQIERPDLVSPKRPHVEAIYWRAGNVGSGWTKFRVAMHLVFQSQFHSKGPEIRAASKCIIDAPSDDQIRPDPGLLHPSRSRLLVAVGPCHPSRRM